MPQENTSAPTQAQEWCSGRVQAVGECRSETLWIGQYHVADVWEIAEGFLWTVVAGGRGYVSRERGTFEYAKAEARAKVMSTQAKHPDLGLTVDEAIARYIREIADGTDCAAKLREQGFDAWCEMWWAHHGNCRFFLEWDSRNYDAGQMREIYDGVIAHASRTVQA